jgi:hypothetical protein
MIIHSFYSYIRLNNFLIALTLQTRCPGRTSIRIPDILTDYLRGLSQSLQAKAGRVRQIDNGRVLQIICCLIFITRSPTRRHAT